jgi:polar amino acid transport system substrate-binding protein
MPSFGMRGHSREAKQAGIDGYLVKPLRQSDLFTCIATVMANVQSQAKPLAEDKLSHPTQLITKNMLKERVVTKPILVVEDNQVNQKVIKLQLERMGFAVDAAYNGKEALTALAQNAYSLVLMDCQMPEMDGYEATGAIRHLEKGLHRTPVIAVTANAMQGEREKCLAAGMDDYLSKPIKKEALMEILERWLKSADDAPSFRENPKADETTNDLINWASLQEVTDDVPEMMEQIINLYLKQTRQQLDGLAEAIQFGDADEIYRIAHKCLGSSATCGISGMIEPLMELEAMGRERKIENAEQKLTYLEQVYRRLEPVLEKTLKEIRGK